MEKNWLRGRDLNPGPQGYEPCELPGCSTPRSRRAANMAGLFPERKGFYSIARSQPLEELRLAVTKRWPRLWSWNERSPSPQPLSLGERIPRKKIRALN